MRLALLIALPLVIAGAGIFLTLAIREGNRVHRASLTETESEPDA